MCSDDLEHNLLLRNSGTLMLSIHVLFNVKEVVIQLKSLISNGVFVVSSSTKYLAMEIFNFFSLFDNGIMKISRNRCQDESN